MNPAHALQAPFVPRAADLLGAPDRPEHGLLLVVLLTVLSIASVTDLRERRIPNWLTFPAALIASSGAPRPVTSTSSGNQCPPRGLVGCDADTAGMQFGRWRGVCLHPARELAAGGARNARVCPGRLAPRPKVPALLSITTHR